jgi:hypothetical protein
MVDTADVAAQVRRMSPQRWSLAFAALVAAALVPIVTGVAGSGQSPVILAIVVGLAGASVTQPDSHVALTVPLVGAWHWTASTDASTSGWALAVAVCLFAFHTLVALMSTTPARATIDTRSVVRWLRRSVAVVAATGAVWVLVHATDRIDLAGSAVVTTIGFVAAITLMVALVTPRRTEPRR